MGELSIQHFRKEFEDEQTIVAVDDLNIDIDDGEFLVLVGPSGCGKSTTLRAVAGLEMATGGKIFLDGEDITDKPPKQRNIAMVFQNYALYPHMTARQNMGFGLKMSTDLSEDEIDDRVVDTATMMGIEGLLDKKPDELSGGQQQRVALGRAIVREPEVFLMDEPLSNLDAKLRTQMRTELQNLQQNLEATTIYVTHDQTEAMTMGDRVAILNGGKLQQVGTPLECYYEPENQFVAGFIGSPSMNFFDVEFTDGELRNREFTYPISAELRNSLDRYGSKFSLGIRPESIEIAESSGETTVSAPVSVVEPMGELSYVYIEIGDQMCTLKSDSDLKVRPGDTLDLRFPEDDIYLFDAETGNAVKTKSVAAEPNLSV